MRRRPNPWIAVPSLLMGLLAGAIGWTVTEVSCRQATGTDVVTSCYGWAGLIALVAFLAATIGVAIILVLIFRSVAEWRESR